MISSSTDVIPKIEYIVFMFSEILLPIRFNFSKHLIEQYWEMTFQISIFFFRSTIFVLILALSISYWFCNDNQYEASISKISCNKTATSGVTSRRPFIMSFSTEVGTPISEANSFCLISLASNSSLMISPGWMAV